MAEIYQADDDRNPVFQVNAFRKFVMQELQRRANMYPMHIGAPFVRLTSCMLEPQLNYVYFTLGLHGYQEEEDNIFDVTYGGGREIVGYAYDIKNNMQVKLISTDQLSENIIPPYIVNNEYYESGKVDKQRKEIVSAQQDIKNLPGGGAHPIPGITDVQVKRQGLGTPVVVNVKWKCYNRYQLEYLRHHFLMMGNYVVIEWGHQFSNQFTSNILDFGDLDTVRNYLSDSVFLGRGNTIKKWNLPNSGCYDFLAGMVSNFKINLDSSTGIYECITTIVTAGELPWGLENFSTYIVKSDDDSEGNEILEAKTFTDYFVVGGYFDSFVRSNQGRPEFVTDQSAQWSKNKSEVKNESTKELGQFHQNAEDYQFISWQFFVRYVIPDMFARLDHPAIKKDLDKFVKFYENPDAPPRKAWVGNNPFLKSIDPDVMVIKKQDMAHDAFDGAGYFGQGGEPDEKYRGTLDKGVWLNAGMIREAFLTTKTFGNAMSQILSKMNMASGLYWQLSLFFDDEASAYRIVDNKFTDPKIKFSLYKFNKGTNGELLNINLDSAFPPSLMTQMALFSKFTVDSLRNPQGTLEATNLLSKFPSMGTTATHIFSLNWTNLRDTLEHDLAERRSKEGGKAVQSNPGDLPSLVSPSLPESNTQRTVSKLATPFNLFGATVLNKLGSPSQGSSLNTTALSNPPAGALQPISPVRNSVRPTSKSVEETMYTDITYLVPAMQPLIRQLMDIMRTKYGYTIRITETYRSQARQEYLYNQRPPVTKTLKSYHRRGRAVDFIINNSYKNDAHYFDMRKEAQALGLHVIPVNVFRDLPHVEWRGPAGGPLITPVPDTVENRTTISPATSTAPTAPIFPIPSSPSTPVIRTTPDFDPTAPARPDATEAQKAAIAKVNATRDDITNRYGAPFLNIIAISPSVMQNQITRDGYRNHRTPNSYVTFPTTTTVELEILGLSGISVGDAFYVDKLPFVFERHGCFQITEVSESINEKGWVTKLRAVFKMMNLDSSGPDNIPVTSLTTTR